MSPGRVLRVAKVAARNSVRFGLQSALIALAAAIGVAGVLVSDGYADGGRQKIVDRFTRLGTLVIAVTPRQSRAVGGRARTGAVVETLTAADYGAVRTAIPVVDAASAVVTASYRIRAGDLTKSAAVVGCEPDYFRIKHWDVSSGALFTRRDQLRQARVALLGHDVAQDLFGSGDPAGARVTINRVPFIVVGVLAERGEGLDAADEDDQVYVPLSSAMHRLMNVDYYGAMLFELADVSQMNQAASRISAILHRRHRRFSPSADDFQVLSQKSLVDAQLVAFGRLSSLIWWIAASTLAVSSLGIWGVAWIGVGGRVREIGTRRAIGAKRADILVQFLGEALIGCLAGSAGGVAVGYAAILELDAAARQQFVFDSRTALWLVSASIALFAAFIFLASGRAARLDPIDALRAE